ncbi:MAG: sulfite exporter TauE/SafE family protein [Chloroflexi bacterium]|nr:sulfite exporter TauE/SafE family protein [Chloroflexota bacterium]
MPDLVIPLVVTATALVAGTIAAVAGFGGAAIMTPVLVWAFGVRDAIPLLTVAQLVGNGSRVWFNRRELDWRVVSWFALGAVPLAALGGVIFAAAPAPILRRLLGLFLILSVVYRHTALGKRQRVGLRGFAWVGAVFGFLSALLGSVGPLQAPFFLAYGLVKGAYIGTEALSTVIMHVVKIGVYSGYSLLSLETIYLGLAIGSVLIVGSYLGKRILQRVPENAFPIVIEGVLVIAGGQFLILG